MNTCNNRKRKSSIEKIEKTFLQLIQKKNIDEISVSNICELAGLNRSTFYSNYMDIYDLTEKVKDRMANEFASMYVNDFNSIPSDTSNFDNSLKMFRHIKENQIFYKTYFKLESSTFVSPVKKYNLELAQKFYDNKHIDYHIEFFRAGLNALIKKWLSGGCKESPEEMVMIIASEYKNKS